MQTPSKLLQVENLHGNEYTNFSLFRINEISNFHNRPSEESASGATWSLSRATGVHTTARKIPHKFILYLKTPMSIKSSKIKSFTTNIPCARWAERTFSILSAARVCAIIRACHGDVRRQLFRDDLMVIRPDIVSRTPPAPS